MKRRKPKYTGIPGLGAARSAHLNKRLRDERKEAAMRFVEYSEEQMLLDDDFNYPKDTWVRISCVQEKRIAYLRALAADTYRKPA